MIEALADPAASGLSEEALKDRLRVLVFRDVDRAARTLAGLVGGSSRGAKLFRVLTPPLLRFLIVDTPAGRGPVRLPALGREPREPCRSTSVRCATTLPAWRSSRRSWAADASFRDLLEHVPEEVTTIATGGRRADRRIACTLVKEATSSLGWRDPERKLDGLRRFKRRAMFASALSDLGGRDRIDRRWESA